MVTFGTYISLYLNKNKPDHIRKPSNRIILRSVNFINIIKIPQMKYKNIKKM
jgi:hypothetical protein